MFSPTSTSAMSIETISKAVCESSRRASTVLEMRSGFSSTSQCEFGRADGADDALAHPGDDRLFGGPADQLLQVGPNGDPGLDLQLDAVLGDAVERVLAGAARRDSRSPWDRRWSARLRARCGRPGRWPWPA